MEQPVHRAAEVEPRRVRVAPQREEARPSRQPKRVRVAPQREEARPSPLTPPAIEEARPSMGARTVLSTVFSTCICVLEADQSTDLARRNAYQRLNNIEDMYNMYTVENFYNI